MTHSAQPLPQRSLFSKKCVMTFCQIRMISRTTHEQNFTCPAPDPGQSGSAGVPMERRRSAIDQAFPAPAPYSSTENPSALGASGAGFEEKQAFDALAWHGNRARS